MARGRSSLLPESWAESLEPAFSARLCELIVGAANIFDEADLQKIDICYMFSSVTSHILTNWAIKASEEGDGQQAVKLNKKLAVLGLPY